MPPGPDMPLPGDPQLEIKDEGADTLAAAKELLTAPEEDMARVERGEQSKSSGPEGLVDEAKEILARDASAEVESFLDQIEAQRSDEHEWKALISSISGVLGWSFDEAQRGMERLLEALTEFRNHKPAAPDEASRADGPRGPVQANTFLSFADWYFASRYSAAVADRLRQLVYTYATKTGKHLLNKYRDTDAGGLSESEENQPDAII